MTRPAAKPSKPPAVPEKPDQQFKRGPRPQPGTAKGTDPERDRYGDRAQRDQTDTAGRERRDLHNHDRYGDFLRDEDKGDSPSNVRDDE
jgi:hypothetical protein